MPFGAVRLAAAREWKAGWPGLCRARSQLTGFVHEVPEVRFRGSRATLLCVGERLQPSRLWTNA